MVSIGDLRDGKEVWGQECLPICLSAHCESRALCRSCAFRRSLMRG